jgi:hypothetical protein
VGVPVVRKVDGSGSLSFAGHAYRVGNAYKRMSATVTIVAGTVQITVDGQLVRTHPIRHDRAKEHGAFAHPAGKPDRSNAAPPHLGGPGYGASGSVEVGAGGSRWRVAVSVEGGPMSPSQ